LTIKSETDLPPIVLRVDPCCILGSALCALLNADALLVLDPVPLVQGLLLPLLGEDPRDGELPLDFKLLEEYAILCCPGPCAIDSKSFLNRQTSSCNISLSFVISVNLPSNPKTFSLNDLKLSLY